MRWKLCALFLGTYWLVGCASMQPMPLSFDGSAYRPATVLPSLSLPDAGWHPYVWGGYSNNQDKFDTNGTDSHADGTFTQTWAAGAGALYQQANLYDDWSLGWFASGEAGLKVQDVLIDYRTEANEPALPADQAALFPARRMSQLVTTDVRAGIQTKQYLGTSTLYGIGAARVEAGDYAGFRRQVDGVGRIVNLSSEPLVLGYGFGIALDIGFRRYWALGTNIEARYYRPVTQTVQEAHVDKTQGTDGTWVVTRSSRGRGHELRFASLGYYFDFQHLRFSFGSAIEFSTLFKEDSPNINGSYDFTIAYRW